jgi:predicted transcriptional regulator
MPLPTDPSTLVTTPDAERIKRLERQNRAIALRKEGWSFEDIGVELGVSKDTARNDVKAALELMEWNNAEMIAEIRQGVLDRNMDIIRSLYEKLLAGDLNAQDRVIRVNQQLMDLVIGQKLDVTTGGEKINEPVRHVEVFLSIEPPTDVIASDERLEITHGE